MAGVRITGLNETIRALRRLGVEANDLKEIMFDIGNKVVDDAKALTPVRTGRLRESIRASKAQRKSVIRGGSARVPYASFVEFGSVHNEAENMVERAITNNERYAATKLDSEFQSLIRKYGLD